VCSALDRRTKVAVRDSPFFDGDVNSMRITGKVKWFNDAKGYGFITPNGGENDCFVHYSAIEGSGFRSLKEGDTVEFEMVDGQKGPSAQNVTKIEA
jgi:CspA family cold shock protein